MNLLQKFHQLPAWVLSRVPKNIDRIFNRIRWLNKIRNKMLLIVMLLISLPLCFFVGLVIGKGTPYIYFESARQNQAQVKKITVFIETRLQEEMEEIAQLLCARKFPAGALHSDDFFFLTRKHTSILALGLCDASGNIIQSRNFISQTPCPSLTGKKRRKKNILASGRVLACISPTRFFREFKQNAIPVRFALLSKKGEPRFRLQVFFSLELISEHVPKWRLNSDTEVMINNSNGEILIHPRLPAGHKTKMNLRSRFPEYAGVSLLPSPNDIGINVLRAYARSSLLGWDIYMEQNIASLEHEVRQMRWLLISITGVSLFLAFIVGAWFISSLVRPIEELEAGIKLLENGLLVEPLPVRSLDEIGRLTQNFNQMVQTLMARNEEIRGKTQKLTFFNEISRIINQSLDLKTIFEKSLPRILQLLQAVAGLVYVFDPRSRKLNLIFQSDWAMSDEELCQATALQNLILKTYVSGKPSLLRDAGRKLDSLGGLVPEKFKDLILAPLHSKKQILGVLALASRPQTGFHYRDLELLNRIGNELGIAVENVQLYTELQLKIKELEEVNQELQELDRFKNRILSNVSHELRTPITSIKTYVDLFLSDKIGHLEELQKEKLLIMQRNINHLLSLINDLLTLARIQDQKIPLKDMEMAVLQEIMDAVISDTIEMAKAKGLQLSRQGITAPVLVRVNRQKIHQVFQNLVSNAIKFTETGSIVLEIKALPDARPAGVEISVADTGIGIPKKSLEKIFQRFYQVDSSSTRKYVGTGLGLAIVKEILEAHGAAIQVESKVGQGSRFYFTLIPN